MTDYDDALDLLPQPPGVELLQKTPLFAQLGFEETQRLAAISRLERFALGQLVIEQGALGHALYLIRAGEVAVYRRDSRGQRDEVARLGAGELFGEMSLVDDLLASADVEVCSAEAELVTIPRAAFEELIAADERFALKVYRSFCRTLAEKLRRLNQRFAELNDTSTS